MKKISSRSAFMTALAASIALYAIDAQAITVESCTSQKGQVMIIDNWYWCVRPQLCFDERFANACTDKEHYGLSVSIDPNDKVGPRGMAAARFLSPEASSPYAIYFENLETATASAQQVLVTDQLDVATLDVGTFSLGPITFAETSVIPPPGSRRFSKNVDLRPAQNLMVRIDAGLDESAGVATWRFTSIDPDTLQLPDDPLAGFLPPNIHAPEGEGNVLFTIRPKTSSGQVTELCNQASIIFDVNAPILTPQWCNTIDSATPASRVLPLAAVQASPTFELQWAGTDEGSGVQDYSVFVSVDNSPFSPLFTDAIGTTTIFTGEPGKSYAFFSTARDRMGNVEDAPPAADATTTIAAPSGDTVAPVTTALISPAPNAAGWNNSDVVIRLTALDNANGSGVKEMTFSATGAQPIAATTVSGASASIPITAEGHTALDFFATDNAANQEAAQHAVVNVDKTAPEVYVQFDVPSGKLAFLGRDGRSGTDPQPLQPISTVRTQWTHRDNDNDDDDGGEGDGAARCDGSNTELRTYRVVDRAGNTLTAVVKAHAHAGREVRDTYAEIVSLRYGNNPVITLPSNQLEVRWAVDRAGRLRQFVQTIVVNAHRRDRQRTKAAFDVRKNATRIVVHEGPSRTVTAAAGQILLRLASENGRARSEY